MASFPTPKSAATNPDIAARMSNARIMELVDARRQASHRYYEGVYSRLQRWYDAYRGVWQGRLAQFRNNVNIPFTFAMIQSDVARKVQTSFGTWPIVGFEGYAPEDVARARKNEVLVSAQMKDCDSVVKAADFFLQGDISGTAVARYGWKQVKRMERTRNREYVAPGLQVPVIRERMATVFDGPDWEPVDRLDFWPQPARTKIKDMAWVIHRYYADLDDLIEDANSDYPYFDAAAVQQLKQSPMSTTLAQEYARRRVTYRNEYDYQARASERFAKPVEIWEMHGLVPKEFAQDGVRFRCIAIGNQRVVLKNRESPFGSELPFASYAPMPDPYSFDGVAKTEVAFGPQQTANRLANQKLDALDLLIDPMWVANSGVNINTQHLFSRAGRILLVDGAADETTIRALSPDMRGLQAAYTEVAQLFQFMQLGTGETEALLGGVAGPGRETARGFLGRQENALTRLAMETRLAEEGFIEPMANAFRKLDRKYLQFPHEIRILGSLATTNPTTGLPYEPEQATIDYEDLVPDYRARAVGASQMMGKTVRQQNLVSLLQMMSANPAMMQLVNWANFARQAFELFDFKNVNELLVSQVPMVNQMAQETGQSPMGVAGAVSSPLEQLSPQTLGSLMQTGNAAPMPGLS
jgi:hypothetical protein